MRQTTRYLRTVCLTVSLIASICPVLPESAPGRFPGDCPGLDSIYIGGCCASSLEACLKRIPPCPMAVRLGAFASWIDTLTPAEPCSTRVAAIAARYAFFTDTTKFAIDYGPVTFVGAPGSPGTIILYVSAICPLCKRVYKGLYAEVTAGSLRGIARLGIKVRSSRSWDLALLAARRVGKQSALFLSLADVEERVSMSVIRKKAAGIGLSRRLLDSLSADSSLIREANYSVGEAKQNEVTLTPTIFINCRRYGSYKDPQWIADAARYSCESGSLPESGFPSGQSRGVR